MPDRRGETESGKPLLWSGRLPSRRVAPRESQLLARRSIDLQEQLVADGSWAFAVSSGELLLIAGFRGLEQRAAPGETGVSSASSELLFQQGPTLLGSSWLLARRLLPVFFSSELLFEMSYPI